MPLNVKSSRLHLSVGELFSTGSNEAYVFIVCIRLTGRGTLTTIFPLVGSMGLRLIKTSESAVAIVTTINPSNIQRRGYSMNFALA